MNVALRPQNLGIISLCTGGGGLDLGVELAIPSARSVVLVEREAFACSHLVSAMQQGLMAEAALWSDVTTFDGRPWRGLVDGLIGGIPCQPHSLAGKRLGEEDERDLWSDARRILVQSGAWFVLIENVRGMLSSGGAERVWRDLHRLGFAVEGGLFTAAEVGASHERERIFILAVADHANWRRHDACAAQWRHGPSGKTGGRGGELADPGGQRGSIRISGSIRPDEEGISGKPFNGCGLVELAPRLGRGEGRTEPAVHLGRDAAAGAGGAVADPDQLGGEARRQPGLDARRQGGRTLAHSPSVAMGNTSSEGRRSLSVQPRQPQQADPDIDGPSFLFPPGPTDLSRWRYVLEIAPELEPAFRRVADGLASRLDIARVDRLRMLGNGVVSLQAAYALRTLTARLASRGSAGATRLLGMMELAA